MSSSWRNPVNNRAFFVRQFFFLLPLILMLAGLSFFCTETSPEVLFRETRGSDSFFAVSLKIISSYGNYSIYFLYLVFLIVAFKRKDSIAKWYVFYYILMQLTVTFFTVHTLKRVLGRPRPFLGATEWQFLSSENKYHSFPSGHTAEMCGAVGPFAQKSKTLFVSFCWGFLPAMMGFSRIFLGEHHRTDVFAGALIGSLATYCVTFLTLRKRMQLEGSLKAPEHDYAELLGQNHIPVFDKTQGSFTAYISHGSSFSVDPPENYW